MNSNYIEVVAGVFRDGDKVLLARRKEGKSLAGYWELPGGKLEDGEDPRIALARELKEELNVTVEVREKLGQNIHRYESFNIKLIAFDVVTDEPIESSTDHDIIEWVVEEDLNQYLLAPADIPLLEAIKA